MPLTALRLPENVIIVDPLKYSLCNNSITERYPSIEGESEDEIESGLPRWSISKTKKILKPAFPIKPDGTKFIEFINEELFDEMGIADEAEKYNKKQEGQSQPIDSEEMTLEYEMTLNATRSIASETDRLLKCTTDVQTTNSLSDQKINCGLVNISKGPEKQFSLQCFYCNSEFPLYRWIEFCRHVKLKHNNLEKMYVTSEILEKMSDDSQINQNVKNCNSHPLISKRIQLPMDDKVRSLIMHSFKSKSTSMGYEVINSKSNRCTLNNLIRSSLNKKDSERSKILDPKSNNSTLSRLISSSINKNEFNRSLLTQNATVTCDNRLLGNKNMIAAFPATPSGKTNKNASARPIKKSATINNLPPTFEIHKDISAKLPTLANSFPNEKHMSSTRSLLHIVKTTNTAVKEQCTSTVLSDSDIDDVDFCPSAENYDPNVDHSYSRKGLTKTSDELQNTSLEGENCIRFDKTKPNIVLDFLNELKYYPYLWYTRLVSYEVYVNGLQKLVDTMNMRWDLSLTKEVLPDDIDIIKNWYSTNQKNEITNPDFRPQYIAFFNKCSELLDVVNNDNYAKKACDICKRCCFGVIGLQVHKFRQHGIGEQPYKCYSCGKYFDYVNNLHKHMKKHRSLEKPVPQKKVKSEVRFSCTICKKEFKFEKAFNLHKNLHDKGDRPYECDVCGRRFLTRGVCRQHRRRHFPAQYECEICSKKYFFAFNFKEHIKMHKRHFDYVCEWCGKMFIRQRYFKEHIKYIHRKAGLCNICGRMLKTASALDKHRKTFHLPLIGLPEVLNERTGRQKKRGPAFRKRKYKFIIDPVTKKRRICCPDCDKHYFGYDSLYAHITRIHGYEPPKEPRNLKCKPVGRWHKLKNLNNANISGKDANDFTNLTSCNKFDVDLITNCEDSVKALQMEDIQIEDNNISSTFPISSASRGMSTLLSDEVVCATDDLVNLNEEDVIKKKEDEFVCEVPTFQHETVEDAEFEFVFNTATDIVFN